MKENKAEYTRTELEIPHGIEEKIVIYHDLPEIFGSSLECAFDLWLIRTTTYTAKSFVDYINSKSHITGSSAFTEEEYNQIPQ